MQKKMTLCDKMLIFYCTTVRFFMCVNLVTANADLSSNKRFQNLIVINWPPTWTDYHALRFQVSLITRRSFVL
jgi:hypothetical protein